MGFRQTKKSYPRFLIFLNSVKIYNEIDMESSIFLAKVMGWYLVITSVVLLLRYKTLRREINVFIKGQNAMMIFFFGAFTSIIGLLVVLNHNIWTNDYRVIITIMGWLALIKGVAYLAFPWGWFVGIVNWANKHWWYVIWAIIGFIVGAYVLNQAAPFF